MEKASIAQISAGPPARPICDEPVLSVSDDGVQVMFQHGLRQSGADLGESHSAALERCSGELIISGRARGAAQRASSQSVTGS